jgi:cytochrome c5
MRFTPNKAMVILLLFVSGICGLIISLYIHYDKNAGQDDDIQSVQVFHFPNLFVQQLKNDPDAGKKIFKAYCVSCHVQNPVIAVQAPRRGIAKDWKRWEKTSDAILLERTIRGQGAMPARGGCFECSDEQLRQTIQYILRRPASSAVRHGG